ncbi:hypothetical protein EfsSzw1_33 [Enterococcus phage EfsSzw-1]|uniref:Uncharacterized protein n=1 Tax=Enterococcus phage EfsSzw-1 TaxID=2419745 RepID=A0A411B7I1_9CAUD|nr:hypothetical protein EfsSzw1_33 [Enterococcus phage EfsSzw-1]
MSEESLVGKWMCASDADVEIWRAGSYFDTKEDAIHAGKLAIDAIRNGKTFVEEIWEHVEDILGFLPEEPINSFVVGRVAPVYLPVDVTSLLEQTQEMVYQEVGEVADSYYLTDEIPEDKQDELQSLIIGWFAKNGYECPFTKIVDIEPVYISREESLYLVGVRVDVRPSELIEGEFTCTTRVMKVQEEDLKITEKQIENRSKEPDYLFKTRVLKSELDLPIWAFCKDNITMYSLVKEAYVDSKVKYFENNIKRMLGSHYTEQANIFNNKIKSLGLDKEVEVNIQ